MKCLVVADAREVAADFEERCHCQLHGGVPLTIGIDYFLDSRLFQVLRAASRLTAVQKRHRRSQRSRVVR